MKSLARIKRESAERETKRLERERIKKEKEDEKLRLKKLAHKKRLRKKQNKRYYAKVRKQRLLEREKKGDEFSYFMILLTKNRKRIDKIGVARWKTEAYRIFNESINKNRQEVKYPIRFVTNDKNKSNPIKYEIVLIKKIGENEETISKLRNEQGKLIDNVILDKNQYVIVDKHEWLFEEHFSVYGYHPIRDRKTYNFILNEIVLKEISDKYDIRTIQTYRNKVFIHYIDDFDFVICKNSEEAARLCRNLEKDIPKKHKKNVLFIGEINKNKINELVNRMVEKTGWTREMCRKSTL